MMIKFVTFLLLYGCLRFVSCQWFEEPAEYDELSLPNMFDPLDNVLNICDVDECKSHLTCGRHLKRGCLRFFISECQLFYVACTLKRPWVQVDFSYCVMNNVHCNDPCTDDVVTDLKFTDYY